MMYQWCLEFFQRQTGLTAEFENETSYGLTRVSDDIFHTANECEFILVL